MSIELPRFAVLASVHRSATVSSFDPRKKVRIELQTVAVLWTLFKTAIYGRCAQVCNKMFVKHCQKSYSAVKLYQCFLNLIKYYQIWANIIRYCQIFVGNSKIFFLLIPLRNDKILSRGFE